MKLIHTTTKASHYNKAAKHYDEFNEENSKTINLTLEKILKNHQVKTVLDLSCGTGSQVFWLTKNGYDVTGVDISSMMLKVANNKAKQAMLAIKLVEGDMRNFYVGKFDAVITIFNSVGHLTKLDFEKSMRNINSNLKAGGLYIFDIYNLDYLLKDDHITTLTLDLQKMVGGTKIRDIQYSTLSEDGILATYTISQVQKDGEKTQTSTSSQTLQIYNTDQLSDMLARNGFAILEQLAIDGSQFIKDKTVRILTIAKKI